MKTPAPRWVFHAAYPLLYAAIDVVAHVRPALGPGITPWNPQSGLTLVFLMACGWRGLPLAVIVPLIAHELHHGAGDVWSALAAVTANALAIAALAAFSVRSAAAPPWLTVASAGRFIAASAVACLAGSLLFSTAFVASGELTSTDFAAAIARLAFAQLTGILAVAPLLCQLLAPRPEGRLGKDGSRVAIGQAAVLVAMLGGFLTLEPDSQLRYFYLLLIPIIWIALRWSWPGALAAVLALHLALVGAVKLALHTPRFIDLQVLMLALALVAIVLGMAVKERGDLERKARERDAALARAQRATMAGGLSSALAHELNQPITALVSYLRSAQILAGQESIDAPLLRTTVAKAAEEALRTSAVLRRLRDFYQAREASPERVVVAEVCASVAGAFAERVRSEGIRLTVDIASGDASVTADRTHLEIVLFNLLSNAADAVAACATGHREIRFSTAATGEGIRISVEDSGAGVDPVAAERLFEPFNTRKPEGMGLGLAISRELAAQFGGELRATRSDHLGGATFTLYLSRP